MINEFKRFAVMRGLITKMTIYKSIVVLLASMLVTTAVNALDFVSGNQLNQLVSKGYKVQSNDTFGGYSIFAPDGDWIINNTGMSQTTGGASLQKQPWVLMERYQSPESVI